MHPFLILSSLYHVTRSKILYFPNHPPSDRDPAGLVYRFLVNPLLPACPPARPPKKHHPCLKTTPQNRGCHGNPVFELA
ncbi:hypothetical protein NL676_031270 [Syzygium grande]|nr:hypothetical protein NL676_031270 [Syzygium grande]